MKPEAVIIQALLALIRAQRQQNSYLSAEVMKDLALAESSLKRLLADAEQKAELAW